MACAPKQRRPAVHRISPPTSLQRSGSSSTRTRRIDWRVKHAHSQLNPEKDWGRDTLRAIEFAFFVLNEQFGKPLPNGKKLRTIRSRDTVVIASSVSNGGGAALQAAEQDEDKLIDGVAVTEPVIQINPSQDPVIRRGALPAYTAGSRPLADYFTFANLYQPCAALSTRAAGSPLEFLPAVVPFAQARCTSLASKGLLAGSTLAAQAEESLDRLLAYGWEPDTILLQVSHWQFATPAIAMTYTNTYGRFSVLDNLCGFSFAYTDAAGFPIPALPTLATIFGTGNGVPPNSGINIVNNNNPPAFGGPMRDPISVSPSTNLFDFNIDGALCQRELLTGSSANAQRVRQGVAQVQQEGDIRRTPIIIVHGRNDTLIPVNFTSRPYYAQLLQNRHPHNQISYIEVTNAQHFDAFLGFPGYDSRYVPLHVYFNRALDAMYSHLTQGTALPPSQVVRTTPRGGPPVPAITSSQCAGLVADAAGGRPHHVQRQYADDSGLIDALSHGQDRATASTQAKRITSAAASSASLHGGASKAISPSRSGRPLVCNAAKSNSLASIRCDGTTLANALNVFSTLPGKRFCHSSSMRLISWRLRLTCEPHKLHGMIGNCLTSA